MQPLQNYIPCFLHLWKANINFFNNSIFSFISSQQISKSMIPTIRAKKGLRVHFLCNNKLSRSRTTSNPSDWEQIQMLYFRQWCKCSQPNNCPTFFVLCSLCYRTQFNKVLKVLLSKNSNGLDWFSLLHKGSLSNTFSRQPTPALTPFKSTIINSKTSYTLKYHLKAYHMSIGSLIVWGFGKRWPPVSSNTLIPWQVWKYWKDPVHSLIHLASTIYMDPVFSEVFMMYILCMTSMGTFQGSGKKQ